MFVVRDLQELQLVLHFISVHNMYFLWKTVLLILKYFLFYFTLLVVIVILALSCVMEIKHVWRLFDVRQNTSDIQTPIQTKPFNKMKSIICLGQLNRKHKDNRRFNKTDETEVRQDT